MSAATIAYLALVCGICLFSVTTVPVESDAVFSHLAVAFLLWLPVSMVSAMAGKLLRKTTLTGNRYRKSKLFRWLTGRNKL
jgi:hypothetical protein